MKDEIQLLIDAFKEAGLTVGQPAIEAAVYGVYVQGLASMVGSGVAFGVAILAGFLALWLFRRGSIERENILASDKPWANDADPWFIGAGFASAAAVVLGGLALFAFFAAWVKVFAPLGWIVMKALP